MDGIYSSKDPLINTCEYWQIYDPFTRLYDNIFFKTCIKKGRVTYLQEYKPTKQFMEDNELSESTELVICKLRIKRILKDKNKFENLKPTIWFEVEDVAIFYKEMLNNGIKFLSEPFKIGTGNAVEFEDPFGNRLGVTEY